jgi:para-nitrobenzyl esterase
MLLSNAYRNVCIRDSDGDKPGAIMRSYWMQFAKTGNPNTRGLPDWLAYSSNANHCVKLGLHIRVIAVPHISRFEVFDRIMGKILAEVAPLPQPTPLTAH